MNEKTLKLEQEIKQMMNQTLPVRANNGNTMDITNIKLYEAPGVNDYNKQMQMKYEKKGSLIGHIGGKIVIKDSKGKVISESPQIRHLIPVPFVTDRGTYLINGSERHILTQMRLKPGSYTGRNKGTGVTKTTLRFDNNEGDWFPVITMSYDEIENRFEVKVGTTNFNGINFLRLTGFSDMEIVRLIGEGLGRELIKASTRSGNKTQEDLFNALRINKVKAKTEAEIKLQIQDYMKENAKFSNGANIVKQNLGVKSETLDKDVIAAATKKTFAVFQGKADEDDKDDLRYKEVIDDNQFILETIRTDWNKFINNAKNVLERKSGNIRYTDIRAYTKIGATFNQAMSGGTLVQNPEETNPLFIASMNKKVTQLGTGGLNTDAARNEFSARDIAAGSVNRIDPIETPESGKIGLVEHLSESAKVDGGTIKAPVYKVTANKAKMNKSNTVYLSPEEEFDAKVAFFDTKYVEANNGTITFKGNKIPGRHRNKMVDLRVNEIQYVDQKPQNLMGYAANMIPFVAHNDGNRALMGSNMQKQAITLKNREVPLVSSLYDKNTGTTYEDVLGEKYGKPIKAPEAGTITSIANGKIILKGLSGKEHQINFYDYYPLNQAYMTNDLLVKKGDSVKKDQLIAEGWQTKDGKLALGANARIAYMAYNGYNYEDGIVISKSFADKMTSEEGEEYRVSVKKGFEGGRGSNIKNRLNAFTRDPDIGSLDKDGIARVGSKVGPNSTLVAMLKPITDRRSASSFEEAVVAARSKNNYQYLPAKIAGNSYVSGTIKRVNIVNNPADGSTQEIIFTIVDDKPLKVGDKISGRHGNKGTITKILDDDEMPTAEDGKAVDLIFSPLAVPSRKNVGQLFETNAGLIAEKTGKPYLVSNFDSTEKDKVLKKLEEIGIPDGKMRMTLKEKQPDGTIKTVSTENPVTVGNMYMLKLKHTVDDKIQGTSNLENSISDKYKMPTKNLGNVAGERNNPQSIGEMEQWGLQSHGAVWNALESATIKSDGGGDSKQRLALFNAIATGKLDGLDEAATPETLNVLSDNLKVLGLNVKPINGKRVAKSFDEVYDSLAIEPLNEKEFIKMVGPKAEVRNGGMFNASDTFGQASKSEKVREKAEFKADTFVKGGLMDPEIFGDDFDYQSRSKWGYIKLPTPMPNPVMFQDRSHNPYRLLTDKSSKELESIVHGQNVIIEDPFKSEALKGVSKSDKNSILKEMEERGIKPGDMLSVKEMAKLEDEGSMMVWTTGGQALSNMLKQIDVKEEIKKTELALKEAKGKDIDYNFKKMKVLQNLDNKKMKPEDLMMNIVPVAPKYLRPATHDPATGSYIRDDLNILYNNLIKTSVPMDDKLSQKFSDGQLYKSYRVADAAEASSNLYNQITNLTGHTTGKDFKSGLELQGVRQRLGGKHGLVRDKMLAKPVGFSGRSVIGVDPNLKLNEIGVPLDMAKKMYKPFVMRRLIDTGKALDMRDAEKKTALMDKDAREALEYVVKERPVIANRAPSLHKHSILAMQPVIKDEEDGSPVRSIHLNPLVVTGFNADFDGDQMALHVPITENARLEANKIMKPSENLIDPSNGNMIFSIRHEMLLGVYHLTTGSNLATGDPTPYSTYTQLYKDYLDGKIGSTDTVKLGVITATAGAILFNNIIPAEYRDYKKVWNKGAIERMLKDYYEKAEKDNFKKISKMDISNLIDKIKDLGFKASTRSGLSIGSTDFKQIKGYDKIVEEEVSKAMGTTGDKEQDELIGHLKAESRLEKELKTTNKYLDKDNSLFVMMDSGARANAGQIRRMLGTVGVGKDIKDNLVAPIGESHYDGLAPQQYFLHGKDARKGISDRAVATSIPGQITREVVSATQDVIVKESDCKTTKGVAFKPNDASIVGRVALKDVVGSDDSIIVKKNEIITDAIRNKLAADNEIKTVMVRSPLRCRTVGGVCQHCYGASPGTTFLIGLGAAVGVTASQSMGEPVTQMTMNTFHGGGTASSATMGLPRIQGVMNLSKDKVNGAVIAKKSGKITNIVNGIMYDSIFIDGLEHKVPKNGMKSKKFKVKKGDIVKAGDFLTYGDLEDLESTEDNMFLTNADPHELFKYKKESAGQDEALDYTQDYLTKSMEHAFDSTIGKGSIDRKHLETIVGKMTSISKVDDPGDSDYLRGQDVDRNELIAWNNKNEGKIRKVNVTDQQKLLDRVVAKNYSDSNGRIVKKGDILDAITIAKIMSAGFKEIEVFTKPISYDNRILSKNQVGAGSVGSENWFSALGTENVMNQIARGVSYGEVDKLDDPRSRLMSGKLMNIGEGYTMPKNQANSIGTKMFNFFSKK